MAVTTEHFYDGNNSTTSFAYTFPYYKTSDIKVTVGGTLKTESTHYNVTGTNIVFTSGNVPPTGTNNIHIYRDTDVDSSKATFAAGSSIRATDLNNNHLQLLYHAQEHDNLIQTGELANAEGKGQLVNANISATAAIAGTKISPNFGTQNIVTSGTVDGRDLSADGTKLDGIEAGATGDQTNAEIRAAVSAATDSNVFTVADHSKLAAIEASATADQTGAQIKTAYEAEADTNAYTDAEKSKLAGIAATAEVNVQSDWNASSGDAHILNKPTITTVDASSVNTAGAVMNSDLDGKGELLVGDGSGDPTALAVGTNNYVLTADSNEATGVKWAVNSAVGEVNQNAFSNVAVSGQTTVAADSATDTLTLAGGSNITLTTNDSTDTVTIAASGGEVTVQDEGSALSTAATTINFVGNGVTATGTGATKTVTIPGGGASSIDDDSIVEAKLDIHNDPSGTDKYLKYTSNGMEWATAGSGTPEGTVILSTGESGTTKFLRVDGDGSCSWQVPPDTNTQLSTEQVQDIVGAMFTGNTETNISATYEDSDGTIDLVSTDTNTQLSTEEVQDIVGAMFTGNTETNIAATYEDSDGTIDLVSTDTVYTHPNHSGEVTSTADGATVIASNIVDEDNLKVSNGPTNGYVLTARSGNTGGMTWETTQTAIGQITEHKATMTANHTIGTGNNGLVAGPFSPGSYTLTIPSGSTFTVV